uniref:Dynactin subunit 6 n=1 Tax=Zosterops lateralis melanops TaxID=1220523 RepID=A0A8D2NPI8_ZOSLA
PISPLFKSVPITPCFLSGIPVASVCHKVELPHRTLPSSSQTWKSVLPSCRYPENITPESEDVEPKPMVIGTNNVFEVGCCILAVQDSSLSPLSLAAFVGRNVILTSGCIIGACCNVNTYEVIPENTVIYGADCLRRVQTERPQPQTLQLDFLMKILPNYHHLKKTMKPSSTPVKS